jgi:hypothetical protein
MRRLALLLLAASLIGGCVNQLALRQAQLSQLVGHPESDLIQQMGVPDRTYETGGVKYLAYSDSRVDFIPATPFPYGPPYWGWYGGGFPPQVVNLICETTFAIQGGLVRSFTLRGNACG